MLLAVGLLQAQIGLLERLLCCRSARDAHKKCCSSWLAAIFVRDSTATSFIDHE